MPRPPERTLIHIEPWSSFLANLLSYMTTVTEAMARTVRIQPSKVERNLLWKMAGLSILLHAAPLLLFSIQLPVTHAVVTQRVELGMALGGEGLESMGYNLPQPPQGTEDMGLPEADSRNLLNSGRIWSADIQGPPLSLPERLESLGSPLNLQDPPPLGPVRDELPDLPSGVSPDQVAALAPLLPPPGLPLPDAGIRGIPSELPAASPEDRVDADSTGELIGIVDGDPGLRQRRILQMPEPVYPQGENTAARVVLRFNVLPDGSVIDVRVERRGGPAFDLEAVRALRRWRFEPLPSTAAPVTQWGRMVVRFSVE